MRGLLSGSTTPLSSILELQPEVASCSRLLAKHSASRGWTMATGSAPLRVHPARQKAATSLCAPMSITTTVLMGISIAVVDPRGTPGIHPTYADSHHQATVPQDPIHRERQRARAVH